ncbi:glycosyltransferase family 2 protein [Flavobacterium sp. CYK-4]|nr:glycosyltransferase family 2 protein [Flavobacterium lotistagni]
MPLSALIITYNEENHISEVLHDIDFADEIIVIDSFSSDKTVELVNDFKKAQLIQHKFVDYSSQRNFAIECAKNPWILFIDADERFTDELKEEVIETIQKPNAASAYLFYRIFMFEDRKLNFSGWQTDKIFRLFQKDKAHYVTERLVHEKLTVKGKIAKLKHKLIHFSYTDFDTYKSKMVNYGKLKAKEELAKGIRPNFYHFYLHPAYKFLYQFIVRLGFLDGKKGVIVCYLNALSVYVRYQELLKMQRKK